MIARRVHLRAAAALAAALLASPALAFVRTADRSTGAPLAWPLPIVPWHLNRDWPHTSRSCQVDASGNDPTLAAVLASFAEWEQPGSDLHLLYAGESPEIRVGAGGSGGNVVVFRRGWCSQNAQALADGCLSSLDLDCGGTYDCFDDGQACVGRTAASPCSSQWGIVALTSVLYDPATGRIMSADIEVNGWDGNGRNTALGGAPQFGWYFTCYPGATQQPAVCTTFGQDGCAYIDLQNTVTHEVGHFLGLAHPCTMDTSSVTASVPLCTSPPVDHGTVAYLERTMSPTTSAREVKKRVLSADDVAGVRAIYPATSGCACGAGGGAGAISALLAVLALRPLRRRRVR